MAGQAVSLGCRSRRRRRNKRRTIRTEFTVGRYLTGNLDSDGLLANGTEFGNVFGELSGIDRDTKTADDFLNLRVTWIA